MLPFARRVRSQLGSALRFNQKLCCGRSAVGSNSSHHQDWPAGGRVEDTRNDGIVLCLRGLRQVHAPTALLRMLAVFDRIGISRAAADKMVTQRLGHSHSPYVVEPAYQD